MWKFVRALDVWKWEEVLKCCWKEEQRIFWCLYIQIIALMQAKQVVWLEQNSKNLIAKGNSISLNLIYGLLRVECQLFADRPVESKHAFRAEHVLNTELIS
jgi:hypothetical protein